MGLVDKNLSLRNRNKMLVGVWEDEDALLSATQAVVDKGIHIHDIFTPYPVHGLERIMGVKRSRLARVSLFCGVIGLSLMFLMIWYMYVKDWPVNVGNKPVRFSPSWIPVMFEGTILCTAYGMGIVFFLRNRMLHGIKNDLLDERQTDDRMIMTIETCEGMDEQGLINLMKEKGAVETREFHHGVQTVI